MHFGRRDVLGGIALVASSVATLPKLYSTPEATSSTSALIGSVKDYGAKGDGSTDDAAAISTAIDAVASRSVTAEPGGIVYFPPGYYLCSTQLQVPKNILLVGESPYATRLQYTGSSTSSFLVFGAPGVIAEYSGVESMWIDCVRKADVAIELWGPQEGSRISGVMAVGAAQVVVDVHSSGISGGSNKFVVEKSWLWTSGDDGIAGIRFGSESGPLSIRDTTFVGTDRTTDPPTGSAGILATDSKITLDNVNVEHYETYAILDRTMADIRSPTAFHTTNGVRTTAGSGSYPLMISNAVFDNVVTAVEDGGTGVSLTYCTSYTSEPGGSPQGFHAAGWSVGSANVYESDTSQARIGFVSDATDDTTRFKFSTLTGQGWRESAAVDTGGVFGTAGDAFNESHLRIGAYHLWVDGSGQLRMKRGAPGSDDDGSVVGAT